MKVPAAGNHGCGRVENMTHVIACLSVIFCFNEIAGEARTFPVSRKTGLTRSIWSVNRADVVGEKCFSILKNSFLHFFLYFCCLKKVGV